MELSILYLKEHKYIFLNHDAFSSWIFVFIFANSAEPDERRHFMWVFAFLAEYLFTCIQNGKK